jgi:maltose O-acetyltransferase
MTPKQKMLAGLPYDPVDPELDRDRLRSQSLCQALNALPPRDEAARLRVLAELFGKPVDAIIRSPFFCDYGYNLEIGAKVFINVGCVVLDTYRVSIGDRTLLGPNVQLLAALHPMDVDERTTGIETGLAVIIEEDVWLGGGVIVCPGVTIGRGTVVGAGSVVTRSLPANVFAAGNPCRVMRRLDGGIESAVQLVDPPGS